MRTGNVRRQARGGNAGMRGPAALAVAAGLALAAFAGGGVSFGQEAPAVPDQKTILDFETAEEIDSLRRTAENMELDIVQDNAVTRGRSCARIAAMREHDYASLVIADRALLKDADKYEYVGLDVYNGSDRPVTLHLELWDDASVDYQSRSTMDGDPAVERTAVAYPGMNNLFWRIDMPRRNAKEGQDWRILKKEDIVDRAALKQIKIFFQPHKGDQDTFLWVDNLRFVRAHAVGGRMDVPPLPAGAIAWKFGNARFCPPGWQAVALEEALPGRPRRARNVIGTGMTEDGDDWPDTLTGNGLYCPQGDFTFRAEAPDGEYWVWLSATRMLRREMIGQPFEIKVGAQTVLHAENSERTYYGTNGIFRYLATQYSRRPNALWLDYVLPEAEEHLCKTAVSGGGVDVRVNNARLAAMVMVPAAAEKEFREWAAAVREARIKDFQRRTWVDLPPAPAKPRDAGAYTLWAADVHEEIRPWSAPPAGSGAPTIAWRGARGERLAQRICVTPWEDLGHGDIGISDFTGPATIPAERVRRYHMNYRFLTGSGGVGEMALLPWTRIRLEPALTWAYWLWLEIPPDAAPGEYAAVISFRPERGGARSLPVRLTVYPFALEDILPVAYGMYYSPWNFAPSKESLPADCKDAAEFVLRLATEQFRFMREIGFTTTQLPTPYVFAGSLRTSQAEPYWQAAAAAGFGRHPEQKLMAASLPLARRVGRDIFYDLDPGKYGYDWLDLHPGDEFSQPAFRGQVLAIFRAYKEWVSKMGLPVAVEVVDEPRETPNPWNRRRDETIRYADWLREAGFSDTFVTFMADTDAGLDYTPIVDHIDIVSVHAWERSRRLIEKARRDGKTLWFYNTGMDRFSWGFYNWAMGSKGRWEWHFCFPGTGSVRGYPNPEQWYTPFTERDGYALHAPYFSYPGGMTFKSVFFTVQQGITDYAYIRTLERAIETAADDAAKAAVVREARDFLAAVRKTIPEFPSIANMVGAGSGALVGTGLETPVAKMTEHWRQHIAGLLTRLQ